MNIGPTIRNFRLRKGMSQGDLEDRAGLPHCRLSRLERGDATPSLDTLARLATALDVPLAQFVANFERPANEPSAADDGTVFLIEMRRYASRLSEVQRNSILGLIMKMAAAPGTQQPQ